MTLPRFALAVLETLLYPFLAPVAVQDDWVRPDGPRLLVLLPGVNQSARGWQRQREHYRAATDAAIYAPCLDATTTSTEAMADRVATAIAAWRETHGGPVVLVGYSNGGRVAAVVESRVPVAHVVTVGAPLRGTQSVDLAARWMPPWLLAWIGRMYVGVLIDDLVRHHLPVARAPAAAFTHLATGRDWTVWPAARAAWDGTPRLVAARSHAGLMHHPDVKDVVEGVLREVQ